MMNQMSGNRRGFLSVVSATVAVLVGSGRSRASKSKRWMGVDLAKEGSDCTSYGMEAPRLEIRDGQATNLDEVMGTWRDFDPLPRNAHRDRRIENDYRDRCLREGYPILRYERRTAWVYVPRENALIAPNPWDRKPLFLYGFIRIGETRHYYDMSHMTQEQIRAYEEKEAQCQMGSGSDGGSRYNFQVLSSNQATITPYQDDFKI